MIIEAKALKKTFGGAVPVEALKDVDLQINRGEFVGIMGPSGSGKSTLLHMLALLDDPTAGKIIVDGTDIATLSSMQKTGFRLNKLGYVFQEYALLPELNALENVYLPLMMLGAPAREYRRAAMEMMETVGLGKRAKHLISQMSGGEQQRVAIARALVNNSKILFADEPCANLDTKNSAIVMNLLRNLCDERKQTIIMVTHEPEHMQFADRIIWIKDGMIEKEEKAGGR
ncbi:MAG: ABC transporter ATP-binding protein [Dehalococcoidia bacterium]|nr:ABC transporter ATP-binding protein [Dehalococcoidia bacterium]MDD5648655.1 ABC transporter ATP-binding protein [Dehalococcoidia bacterium]